MPAPIDPQVIYSIRKPESKLLLLYFLRSLGGLVLAPLIFIPLWIRYATMSYRFDDQGIRKSYGLIFRHEDLVQYGRIQDLHLTRGLLERWMGLGTIQVQTASGSSMAEMTIEGLSIYDQLRDFLYLKMRGARFGEEDATVPVGQAAKDDALAVLTEIRDELRMLRGEAVVIYDVAKEGLLYVLQAPGHPPEPPPGAASSIRVFRASPKLLQYRLVVMAIFYGVLLIGTVGTVAFLALDGKTPPLVLAFFGVLPFAVLGMAGLSYFLVRLEYDMRYYMLSDRCMRIRDGVLVINEVTLTYANVQHVEISQGPIQQMLGIADLVVKTAGGGAALPEQPGQVNLGHRGVLAGIENAEEVRELISANLKHFKGAGLGDPEERARKGGGLSPAALAMLREVRDEMRSWRIAIRGNG